MFTLSLSLLSCSGTPPATLGIQPDGKLIPCSSKPNCLLSGSQAEGKEFKVFQSHLSKDTLVAKIKSVLLKEERVLLKKEEPRKYLHFEAQSSLMKFTDDVEILILDSAIYFKSASRIGYSDMGVNRDRLDLWTSKLIKEKIIQ